eukprot:6202233-Pleurochrysis_carterae.AAC.2
MRFKLCYPSSTEAPSRAGPAHFRREQASDANCARIESPFESSCLLKIFRSFRPVDLLPTSLHHHYLVSQGRMAAFYHSSHSSRIERKRVRESRTEGITSCSLFFGARGLFRD